jgi:glycosyltransferase involved in cell wall biosynthesis
MRCGAAVVTGNNSSQVEVVGDAGLLVNVHDTADIAAKVARVLDDRDLARRLGARAIAQARPFTWDRTASRAQEALTAAVARRPRRRLRIDSPHGARPRIAVFSPFPPKGSGISDYAIRLVERLKAWYAIDLYHDEGYVPELGLGSHEFGCHDHRVFDRNAAILDYRAILYQMGNSLYHRFIYETLLRHPGIVTLHDFGLAGFQFWYSNQPGVEPGHFERELAYNDPERAPGWCADLAGWADEPGGMQEACARRGIFLNRRIFDRARRVLVHAPWGLDQVRSLYPEHAVRTAVVPMGATPKLVSPDRRAEIRQRFDLAEDALILACFGILHSNKLNVETIEAFRPLAREVPSARLLFVGQDWGVGEARDRAVALGLESRVRFLGRQPTADFDDLIAATDIGISLRRPPTNGETSAALLDLLRSGVPTIITDVAAFSSYPDSVVRKVSWEREGVDGLRRAMWELAGSRRAREQLGRAAAAYVAAQHDWSRAAELYREQIERCSAETARARGPHRPATSPARRAGPC